MRLNAIMRILPVLDLMRGQVVRGVGGRRQEYLPLKSQLTESSDPQEVADAIRSHFGLTEFYIADLDAIAGAEPAWSIFAALRDAGFRLWVDAGIRQLPRACHLADAGIESIVVGLETVEGAAALSAIARTFGERMVFSLDLRQGQPLTQCEDWQGSDAWTIAEQAVRMGVRRLLVLDLARVGLGEGTGTRELCARLSAAYPDVKLSAGGGVRHRGDLEQLRDCAVRTTLVASALHGGGLTHADLQDLR